MKKLIIIILVIFLASCTKTSIIPKEIYFITGANTDTSMYAAKFATYQEYTTALESELDYALRDYVDSFDEAFFESNDLVFVKFIIPYSIHPRNIVFEQVTIISDTITVIVRNTFKPGIDPLLLEVESFGYLLVIDKTEYTHVDIMLKDAY